jgi:predicted TIM-barrel fold metal-dependent hydrolase
LFDRFPNLRVATIETGADWVRPLLKKLRSAAVQAPDAWKAHPVELFQKHVWVSPFFEDDVHDLIGLVGADRVVFGSDWPHAEGLENPASFVKELDGVSDADIYKIMYSNARGLVTRQPA